MLLELWVGWVTAFGFDLHVCVCCCVVVLVVYLGLYWCLTVVFLSFICVCLFCLLFGCGGFCTLL